MSITVVFSRHGQHVTKYMGPEEPFRSVLSDVAGKLGVGKVAYDLFEHKTKSHIKETDTPMKVWDSDLALSVPGRCTSFKIDVVARLEDGTVSIPPRYMSVKIDARLEDCTVPPVRLVPSPDSMELRDKIRDQLRGDILENARLLYIMRQEELGYLLLSDAKELCDNLAKCREDKTLWAKIIRPAQKTKTEMARQDFIRASEFLDAINALPFLAADK